MEKDSFWTEIEVEKTLATGSGPSAIRYALACLSSIPGIGGAIGGIGSAWGEADQKRFNSLLHSWLKLQEEEIKEIGRTIVEVMERVDSTDERVRERMNSPEYLRFIKKCFRDWSAAESEGKRRMIRNLLVGAAAPEGLCSDDVIFLFIEWIDRYSEGHFKIVQALYNHAGITRRDIWKAMGEDDIVAENSAKADLFKVLIRDLSLGSIIRQHQDFDSVGNVIKKQRAKPMRGGRPATSAFDDDEPYELTSLGEWLVHYTMNEVVPKLSANNPTHEA